MDSIEQQINTIKAESEALLQNIKDARGTITLAEAFSLSVELKEVRGWLMSCQQMLTTEGL